MRKKLLAGGLGLLGCAALGMGATGTYAGFVDTEQAPQVLVRAGTLDLRLTTADGAETEPVTFANLSPEAAPVAGTYRPSAHHYFIRLTNDGSLPGRAKWATSGVAERENACNAPERTAGDRSCGDGDDQGELGDQLLVSFSLMPGADCAGEPGVVPPPRQYPATAERDYRDILPGGAGDPLVLAPGEARCVRVDVHFPLVPENNLAQGDSSTFRLGFRLEQIG
ncbi:hypothetical protein [Pseudonocardia nigra]|uniref:hypothetical protein n=1 Tax=Pseudonocardia nigra TaxID=1921578 RepID=UPI001C5E408A|nr:hypothetical protein [Pseudonocardia nigra]